MTLTETDYRPDAPDRPGAALVAAPEALIVERNRTISAVVALLAGLVTAAYLTRAVGGGSLLDWSLAGALGLVAVGYAWSFVDARTPLLVADDYGIRVRIGRSWRGLPWLAIDHVEHTPRSSLLGDGRLALVTRDTDGLVAGLGPMGRLQAQLTERMYGTPFALPLGLSTRVIGYDGDIDLALTALALGRTDIVHPAAEEQIEDLDLTGDLSLDDTDEFAPVEQVEQVEPVDLADPNDLPVSEEPGADHPDAPAAESGWVAGWSRLVARTRGYVDRSAEPGGDETGASVVPSESPGPLRPPRTGRRAEVTVATSEAPEPQVVLAADTGPVVLPDPPPPHRIPVIGPEVAAARQRLGLSVDQLAERTRIRPHVIEAIEADDFRPCGGDFYARGHLRTLARVLGITADPLVTGYDELYAAGPVSPRRVFEAELAGGPAGPLRSVRGGPNWSVLIAVLMTLVLIWSIARLVIDDPQEVRQKAPRLNGSPGTSAGHDAAKVPVLIRAPGGGAHVTISNGSGREVYTGDLSFGDSRRLRVRPPVVVATTDGSVEVVVDGDDYGPIGEQGTAATETYVVR